MLPQAAAQHAELVEALVAVFHLLEVLVAEDSLVELEEGRDAEAQREGEFDHVALQHVHAQVVVLGVVGQCGLGEVRVHFSLVLYIDLSPHLRRDCFIEY